MILTVKTYIDKKAYLIIPDPSVFANAFSLKATEFLESELERIHGNIDRELTKKQFELEISGLSARIKEHTKEALPEGIEANFEFTEDSELIIHLKGCSPLIMSTVFH